MQNKFLHISVLTFAFIVMFMISTSTSFTGEITEDIGNGCLVTRQKPNTTSYRRMSWWEMPLPHLNCSGTGQKRFIVDGVLGDIKGISLSYNNLIELHVEDLLKFENLTKLEVKSNELQRIVPNPSNSTLKKVVYLSFSKNKLTEIPTEALKSFPSLTVLVLSNNKITTVEDDAFKYNTKLQHLMLGINPITSFSEVWMSHLALNSLNVRGCGLTKLPRAISNISSLMFADFSDNKISTVPAYSFAKCSQMYWLELASNRIKFVDEKAFTGANKLTSLDLSDNLLETIAANTFDGMAKENLEVNLYENPLNCNCSMRGLKSWIDNMEIYDASTELRYTCRNPARNHGKKSWQLTIDDYSCKDNDVLWTDCDNTPTLSTLSSTTTTLSTTTRTSQPSRTTRTCPRSCTCWDENKTIYYPRKGQKPNRKHEGWLHWRSESYPRVDCIGANYNYIPQDIPDDVRTIIMYENKITQFQITMLKKFTSLETLFLKKNNIKTIVPDSRVKLPQVSFLHLAHNNITNLQKGHLQSFPNLKVAALYNNKINAIPEDLFAYNSMLNRLYLGPNPIRNFREDFMKTLRLKSLSLRNMSLTEVPKRLSNLINLTYVDLSDNKIESIPNGIFSKCKSLVRVALDNNRISKVEANAFNGAKSLFYIDLSENQLKALPSTVFANISQERLTIELWENRFVCDCNMKGFKSWIEKTEDDDPMTEIRFSCDEPNRMHHYKSDQVQASQFTCQKDDNHSMPHEDPVCPAPQYAGKIALSVVLTFIFTSILGVILWRCAFRRRYGDLLTYAKQRTQFDDMEELQ